MLRPLHTIEIDTKCGLEVLLKITCEFHSEHSPDIGRGFGLVARQIVGVWEGGRGDDGRKMGSKNMGLNPRGRNNFRSFPILPMERAYLLLTLCFEIGRFMLRKEKNNI